MRWFEKPGYLTYKGVDDFKENFELVENGCSSGV
jgi:hypothetical protein